MLRGGFVSVLAAANRGDASAFDLLWRDVNPGLLRYLRLMSGDLAEQVAARTWTDVARGLRSFRGDEQAFRAWVFGVARRHALSGPRAGAPAGQTRAAVTAGATLQDVVTSLALDLVAELPELQAEVLLLRAVGGLAVDDIAQMLQRSRRAVRSAGYVGAAAVGAAAAVRAGTGPPAAGPDAPRPPAVREQEAAFDVLLTGGPAPIEATPDLLLLAYVIDALAGPPTAAELGGAQEALDDYDRYVVAGTRPQTVTLAAAPPGRRRAAPARGGWLAAAAASVTVAVGGAAAAYAGVLPASLQDVAHRLIHAPAPSPSTLAPARPVPAGSGTQAPGGSVVPAGSERPTPGAGPSHTGAGAPTGTGPITAINGPSGPQPSGTGTTATDGPAVPSASASGPAPSVSAPPHSGPPGTHPPHPSGKPSSTHPGGQPPTSSSAPPPGSATPSHGPGASHTPKPHGQPLAAPRDSTPDRVN